MILTEEVYAINQNQLEGLVALEAQLMAADIKPPHPTKSTIVKKGSVAIIAINGSLFPKPNILTLLGFGTDLLSIQTQLEQAISDSGIRKIILNFDSPGGSITGINELANTIKAIDKPTTAYITGMAASAALWLASACNEVVCDATAFLGSVGVVGVFQKTSKDKIEIVSSNAMNKRPNVETEEGKTILLNTINDLESVFISSLIELNPKLTEEKIKALRGGILIGEKAVNAGLADGIGSLKGVINGEPIQRQPKNTPARQLVSEENPWSAAIATVSQNINSITSIPERIQAESEENGWDAAAAIVSGKVQCSAGKLKDEPIDDGWDRAFAKVTSRTRH